MSVTLSLIISITYVLEMDESGQIHKDLCKMLCGNEEEPTSLPFHPSEESSTHEFKDTVQMA